MNACVCSVSLLRILLRRDSARIQNSHPRCHQVPVLKDHGALAVKACSSRRGSRLSPSDRFNPPPPGVIDERHRLKHWAVLANATNEQHTAKGTRLVPTGERYKGRLDRRG